MAIKRKPFFIKGNFQLKFILCFISLLILGVSFSALMIHEALNHILEEASFSAHMSLSTSGQLLWRTIIQINVLMGSMIIAMGLLMGLIVHFYSETLFYVLAKGLDHLKQGDFSFRIKRKGQWAGKNLIGQFNHVASGLSKRLELTCTLLNEAIKLTQQKNEDMAEKLEQIHKKIRQGQFP